MRTRLPPRVAGTGGAALGLAAGAAAGLGVHVWRAADEIVRFPVWGPEELRDARAYHDPAQFGVAPEEFVFVTRERHASRAGVVKYVGMLARAGYDVLAYDQRRHGESEGRWTTWGAEESHDVSAAIDALARVPGLDRSRLGIMGESMGAAIAILAAARDPRIRIVVADSSYTDLRSLFRHEAGRRYRFVPLVLVGPMLWLAGRRGHFRPGELAPLQAIRRVAVPTLILHGGADAGIPVAAAHRLLAASPAAPKRLHVFPGSTHTFAFEDDPAAYARVVLEFVEANLG